MKKIVFVIASCIILIAVICSLCIHLAPVRYDAGACGGGFDTWIFDKYKNELLQEYTTEHNSELSNIEIIENSRDINYEGRYISIQFDIKENDKKHTLYFVGKRVWVENYKWDLCQVLYDGEVKNLSDYIAGTQNINQTNFTVWVLPLLIGSLLDLYLLNGKKAIFYHVFLLCSLLLYGYGPKTLLITELTVL